MSRFFFLLVLPSYTRTLHALPRVSPQGSSREWEMLKNLNTCCNWKKEFNVFLSSCVEVLTKQHDRGAEKLGLFMLSNNPSVRSVAVFCQAPFPSYLCAGMGTKKARLGFVILSSLWSFATLSMKKTYFSKESVLIQAVCILLICNAASGAYLGACLFMGGLEEGR